MMASVETYLAVRRAVGFTLSNTEYLLRSFADFAAGRKEAKRNRLRSDTRVTRPSAALRNTFASKTPGTNYHRRSTSATGKLVVSRTFIHATRLMGLFSPPRGFHHRTCCCPRRMRR